MGKSACHFGHFFAILKSTLPSVKKTHNLAVSQNGITLQCGDNVNAVLGPWVPSHRLGDPLHKRFTNGQRVKNNVVRKSRPLCAAATNARPPCFMISDTPA
jgi:hypothetical protein